MTKRTGSYYEINNKKLRLEDDDIWDDDLDPETIDKCFELATQVTQDATRNDISLLPDYTIFKNPLALSSSTQAHTSEQTELSELQANIQTLKQKNEEQEGELLILRSKIQERSIQYEKQKTLNEWRDKLQTTQKDLRLVKSDLEFKNLEISNLKQQLAEVRRLSANQQAIVKIKQDSPKTEDCPLKKKEPILNKDYPLKCLSSKVFTAYEESHLLKTNSYETSRKTIPYLQNQQTYIENTGFNHKCPQLRKQKITAQIIHTEILEVINSDSEQLSNCTESIKKIVIVFLILLKDLDDYFRELGTNLRTEEIQQADVSYLLKEISITCEHKQVGVEASKLLTVLAKLLPYNKELVAFVCNNRNFTLPPDCLELAQWIPHQNGAFEVDYYFLNLLSSTVNNIGKYRLTRQCNIFLLPVVNFLESIAALCVESYINEWFLKIFKGIVFARPEHEVLKRLSFVLKLCGQYKSFVNFLFSKKASSKIEKATPKGVLYFNDGACCFCVLAILLQNFVSKAEQIPLEMCHNMLSFVHNTFKTSHWIHHENGKNTTCECLSLLYKLAIDFMFNSFVKCPKDVSGRVLEFLNKDIAQRVLSEITFNNFELIDKYVKEFSQYKEIETFLKNAGLFKTSQLNTSEEMLNVSFKNFNKDF
ncbi:hypothetical protein ABEB36_004909 [Hypothenemus hampei]|uniref:Uncharacterized protein n=1 Tax=Hypothenemus hampei TaxID=57062 RepID=A0ABD1EW95_HYPHA